MHDVRPCLGQGPGDRRVLLRTPGHVPCRAHLVHQRDDHVVRHCVGHDLVPGLAQDAPLGGHHGVFAAGVLVEVMDLKDAQSGPPGV